MLGYTCWGVRDVPVVGVHPPKTTQTHPKKNHKKGDYFRSQENSLDGVPFCFGASWLPADFVKSKAARRVHCGAFPFALPLDSPYFFIMGAVDLMKYGFPKSFRVPHISLEALRNP